MDTTFTPGDHVSLELLPSRVFGFNRPVLTGEVTVAYPDAVAVRRADGSNACISHYRIVAVLEHS